MFSIPQHSPAEAKNRNSPQQNSTAPTALHPIPISNQSSVQNSTSQHPTSSQQPLQQPLSNMGCGSSKPHWEEDQCHCGRPVDRKTQRKYQKAYITQAKRNRRNKCAAVTTSGVITSYLGYVLNRFNNSRYSSEDRWLMGSIEVRVANSQSLFEVRLVCLTFKQSNERVNTPQSINTYVGGLFEVFEVFEEG
jgi:hypothetical protein